MHMTYGMHIQCNSINQLKVCLSFGGWGGAVLGEAVKKLTSQRFCPWGIFKLLWKVESLHLLWNELSGFTKRSAMVACVSACGWVDLGCSPGELSLKQQQWGDCLTTCLGFRGSSSDPRVPLSLCPSSSLSQQAGHTCSSY